MRRLIHFVRTFNHNFTACKIEATKMIALVITNDAGSVTCPDCKEKIC